MRSLLLITAIACAACAPEQIPVEIEFGARWHGEPLSCGHEVNGVRLTDLRFYVSDLRLRDTAGEWLPVTLTNDAIWQSDKVALVDLETGEGACMNGSPETNTVVRGTVPTTPGTGLAFRIGVPESLNHADPLVADAPLAYTVMHWHWASGYKFMRAGLETGDDGFFLHLGSNRCEGTIGDIRGCRGANRAIVELTGFKAGENVVVIDIAALFDGVNLSDAQPGECMSGPANEVCKAPLNALGIDFASGEALTTAPAFRSGQPR